MVEIFWHRGATMAVKAFPPLPPLSIPFSFFLFFRTPPLLWSHAPVIWTVQLLPRHEINLPPTVLEVQTRHNNNTRRENKRERERESGEFAEKLGDCSNYERGWHAASATTPAPLEIDRVITTGSPEKKRFNWDVTRLRLCRMARLVICNCFLRTLVDLYW